MKKRMQIVVNKKLTKNFIYFKIQHFELMDNEI